MTPVILLKDLAAFLRELLADYNAAKGLNGEIAAPQVYEWYLPFKNAKAGEDVDFPYVTVRITEGADNVTQPDGSAPSTCSVVLTFGVYSAAANDRAFAHPDGAYDLLNLMEKVRVALNEKRVIGGKFELQKPYTWTIPEDGQPYPLWIGEAVTTWAIQGIETETERRFLHG